MENVVSDTVNIVISQIEIRQSALGKREIQFDEHLIGQRQLEVRIRLVVCWIDPWRRVGYYGFNVFDARYFGRFRVVDEDAIAVVAAEREFVCVEEDWQYKVWYQWQQGGAEPEKKISEIITD